MEASPPTSVNGHGVRLLTAELLLGASSFLLDLWRCFLEGSVLPPSLLEERGLSSAEHEVPTRWLPAAWGTRSSLCFGLSPSPGLSPCFSLASVRVLTGRCGYNSTPPQGRGQPAWGMVLSRRVALIRPGPSSALGGLQAGALRTVSGSVNALQSSKAPVRPFGGVRLQLVAQSCS